jgi:hypothetical protein
MDVFFSGLLANLNLAALSGRSHESSTPHSVAESALIQVKPQKVPVSKDDEHTSAVSG